MVNAADYVYFQDHIITTDSRRLAMHYGQSHDKVLQAINNLGCSAEYRAKCFRLAADGLPPTTGRSRTPGYMRMTKDGFAILGGEFHTRKKAAITEAFITAFDALAAQLNDLRLGAWCQRVPLIPLDADAMSFEHLDVYSPLGDRSGLRAGEPNAMDLFGASIGMTVH